MRSTHIYVSWNPAPPLLNIVDQLVADFRKDGRRITRNDLLNFIVAYVVYEHQEDFRERVNTHLELVAHPWAKSLRELKASVRALEAASDAAI